MPLVISDEVLRSVGMTEQDARVEVACRLFQAGRLSLPMAGKLAVLSRVKMEEELHRRGIPAYVYTEEMLEQDMETLKSVREDNRVAGRK